MANEQRILEGFKGQHLIVVPDDIRWRFERHPLLSGLFVTDAGFFPHASWHFVERPKGAATTLVILCLAGRGWVRIGGRELAVEPGNVVWLNAQRAHAYGADAKLPWTIEWAHVTGSEVGAWAELLELPPEGGIIRREASASTELPLGRVWQCLERGYTLANLVAAGVAFRHVLAALKGERAPPGTRSPRDRVAATIDWMKLNLGRQTRLDELASLAGMSSAHYSALFRRQIGFPPVDFFLRLRIQRACQLLVSNRDPIAAIAQEVGFADPYYFTRYFRRVMGCSPRDYRKTPKG
ncbi:MAG: AraC family transcriptional regulator [Opitutae bacterium]|nr:AraC family transcriptional regulator [Opitutae bacterium]